MFFQFASIAIIAYRVATFNDCPEAAKELKLVSNVNIKASSSKTVMSYFHCLLY